MTVPLELWPPPPDPLTLDDSEVHVWRIKLDVLTGEVERLRRLLAPDEQARADRLVFEGDRRRTIAARGTLRTILGRYLGTPPDSLRFCYNSHGKPALAGEPGSLRFNVSHSGDLALIAVARARAVGVDIERLRPNMADEQLARRFFSPPEVASLLALAERDRQRGFFTCWTRKEAYIKARGEGLSIPLDQFQVSLAPGEPAALLSVQGGGVARWSLHELRPGPGYIAALAVEGHHLRIKGWSHS
jgi:4'-phosphopantetheinyl transferase